MRVHRLIGARLRCSLACAGALVWGAASPAVALAAGGGAAGMAPPVVDESWLDRPVPEVGEGGAALTVVLRGAPRDTPLVARLGAVEGRLEHLGLAIFAVRLRGVPPSGRLALRDATRTLWSGEVLSGPDALVALSWEGAGQRIERFPAAPDPPRPPEARPWRFGLAGLWLALGVGCFRVCTRAGLRWSRR